MKKHRYLSIILAVLLLFFDQISKILVFNWHINAQESFTVANKTIIPGLLDFLFVANEGAAFGWFANSQWVFMISSVIFLVVAFYFYFKVDLKYTFMNYAVMLIISGGIGNMIDRIFRGYVVDFIHFSFFEFVFNIADSCIVIGCCMIVLYVILDSFTNYKKPNGEIIEDNKTDS